MVKAKHKQLFKQCGVQDQMFYLHSVLHLCIKTDQTRVQMAVKADFQIALLIHMSLHVGTVPSTPALLFLFCTLFTIHSNRYLVQVSVVAVQVLVVASLVLLHPSCLNQNWNFLLSSEAEFWFQLASPQVLHLSKQQQENLINPQSHEKKTRLIRWTRTECRNSSLPQRLPFRFGNTTLLSGQGSENPGITGFALEHFALENLLEMHWKPPLHISLHFCLLKMGQL